MGMMVGEVEYGDERVVEKNGRFYAQALRYECVEVIPHGPITEKIGLAITRPEVAYDTREEAEAHFWE